MKRRPFFLTLAALLPLGQDLLADEWRVDQPNSRIGFVASYDEIPFEGRFHRFDARIRFEPGPSPQGSFLVDIDIGSVDTDSSDRDEGMLGSDWFDAKRHPRATFESTGFERLAGDSEYAVTGELTIKGITRSITARFVWLESGTNATLRGSADVQRGDFGVGTGDWAEDDTIGFDVQIAFDLSLGM
jgi:polyisoprenoid-binding protein YceI